MNRFPAAKKRLSVGSDYFINCNEQALFLNSVLAVLQSLQYAFMFNENGSFISSMFSWHHMTDILIMHGVLLISKKMTIIGVYQIQIHQYQSGFKSNLNPINLSDVPKLLWKFRTWFAFECGPSTGIDLIPLIFKIQCIMSDLLMGILELWIWFRLNGHWLELGRSEAYNSECKLRLSGYQCDLKISWLATHFLQLLTLHVNVSSMEWALRCF